MNIGRETGPINFGKMRVGVKTLDDAILELSAFKKADSNLGDKTYVLNAIKNRDYTTQRKISNFYFESSGIYQRLCKYIAYLYRYDWFLVPYSESEKEEKVLTDFSKALRFFDNSNIQKLCGDIALEVVKNGCSYIYIIPQKDHFDVQYLPAEYCRSRFNIQGFPAVEFNMKYFDDTFKDINYRLRVLKMFPQDFQRGYLLYKNKKLQPEYSGDSAGWYLLEPGSAFKFNCGGSDFPFLINAIPAIIDLSNAQELDRRKQMQQLLKIIIQKLPLDKNSELVFDVDEAADIHNNAVQMLKRAVGVDVLTTFADIDVADMADSNTATTKDDLEKVERTVYNEFGVSRNLFNSDSNMALTNSILDDEASVRNFVLQFQYCFNAILNQVFKPKPKYNFRFRMLETTIYNYKEMSKLYKEQTQIGYSKMLPQIALGHSQSEILATAHFENEVLHLTELMLPPLSSNTLSSTDILGKTKTNNQSKSDNKSDDEKKGGRPELEDNQKSDKTIKNKESM